MNNNTPARIAAQVATEAIANDPVGYDLDTMQAVLANAKAEGVPALYADMLQEIIDQEVTRRDDAAWL